MAENFYKKLYLNFKVMIKTKVNAKTCFTLRSKKDILKGFIQTNVD